MNRRNFLIACGLTPTSLLAAPASSNVKIDPAQVHQKFTTMWERHEQYKVIAQALHDYGLDIYFFDVAALVTAPFSGFGLADKVNIAFGEVTNQFLSSLNARLFEKRNLQLAADLLSNRTMNVDGKKYLLGNEADVAILTGEQRIAQVFLDANPQKALILEEINSRMNLFADNVEAGRADGFIIALIPSKLAREFSKATTDYVVKKLMYVYNGREALRQKNGQPLLKLDYGKIEHRIAMGKECLAQARAENAGLISFASRTPKKAVLKIYGEAGKFQSTGIYVEKGESVTVSASGTVASTLFLRGTVQSTPEGIAAKPSVDPPKPNLPFLSLVTVVQSHQMKSNGEIVSRAKVLDVGSSKKAWVSPLSGVVGLLVNDSLTSDNNGFFDVTVEVQKV